MNLWARLFAKRPRPPVTCFAYDGVSVTPLDDFPAAVVDSAKAYAAARSWIWEDPIRITRTRRADGVTEWTVYTNCRASGLNLLFTLRETGASGAFVVTRGVQATCTGFGAPNARGPEELVPDEVFAAAKGHCAARSWAWAEPLHVAVRSENGHREWTILTNFGMRGMNASVRVREPDFVVVDGGYLPR